jgi:ELWxxDGT repeat protein
VKRALLLLVLAAVSARAQAFHPYLVKDLTPGTTIAAARSIPFAVRVVGDVVFFGVELPTSALWRTDGTAAGTHPIYDGLRDRQYFDGLRAVVHEGRVFFSLRGPSGTLLYSTDGTTGGTRFITPVSAFAGGATCAPGKLCFSAGGSRIGVTDGTPGGTSILRQVSVSGDEHLTWDYEMTPFRGRAFFNTYDEVNGRCQYVFNDGVLCGELWVSDGTTTGTRALQGPQPGPVAERRL